MSDDDLDRKFWEKRASNYDSAMKLFGRPMPRMLELVGEAVSATDEVLEVAAGTGLVTQAIAPRVRHLIATDYADSMVAVLQERIREAGFQNVECEHGDIYSLAYSPGRFDTVVASNVLHLVPDLPRALGALCRVLKTGGKLVAPTFCHDETRTSWLVSRGLALMGQPMHRRFSTDSLRDALAQAGLQVRFAETIPGLIPIGYVDGIAPADR
jgi:phosphatidylethanolamine/phosphatidyl-N-methylethanolamine N-methyltransferase